MVMVNQWLHHTIALVWCSDLEWERASVFPSGATIDLPCISIVGLLTMALNASSYVRNITACLLC